MTHNGSAWCYGRGVRDSFGEMQIPGFCCICFASYVHYAMRTVLPCSPVPLHHLTLSFSHRTTGDYSSTNWTNDLYPWFFYQIPELLPNLAIAIGVSPPNGILRRMWHSMQYNYYWYMFYFQVMCLGNKDYCPGEHWDEHSNGNSKQHEHDGEGGGPGEERRRR